MIRALQRHWPEYLIEAAGLGLFMISACVFVALLEHPSSPVRQALDDPLLRRALIGLAMGLTAIAIIYSPWGNRSGAHMNPAVTLTFLRLGRVEPWDAGFYVLAQFAGAVMGMLVSSLLLGQPVLAAPSVNFVVTVPGGHGVLGAFVAEVFITFVLMLTILLVSNQRALNRYTGVVAGSLVALYITVEAPLSGMSMNPARTFGSALAADLWTAIWIYFTAPPLGMLAAAEVYARWRGHGAVLCCKLHHENDQRCIFRCRYGQHDVADSTQAVASGPRKLSHG